MQSLNKATVWDTQYWQWHIVSTPTAVSRQATDTTISALTSQVEESEQLWSVTGWSHASEHCTHSSSPLLSSQAYLQFNSLPQVSGSLCTQADTTKNRCFSASLNFLLNANLTDLIRRQQACSRVARHHTITVGRKRGRPGQASEILFRFFRRKTRLAITFADMCLKCG